MKDKINVIIAKCKSLIGCSSCACSMDCKVWIKVLCAAALGIVVGAIVL
jgi:hypothetical protein